MDDLESKITIEDLNEKTLERTYEEQILLIPTEQGNYKLTLKEQEIVNRLQKEMDNMPCYEQGIPVVGQVCTHYLPARSQRIKEIQRGQGLKGTQGYEAKKETGKSDCYTCQGIDTSCNIYSPIKESSRKWKVHDANLIRRQP
jgi:hypothetical protein